jgi:O-antigen ligase
LAKKGPILTLVVILLFVVVFISRKHLKLLLGFALLTGCLFLTSESTLSKYKSNFKINSSITMRAEHYFFGFHVFKKNPVWGLGSHPVPFNYFYCDIQATSAWRQQVKLCKDGFNYDLTFFSKRGRYWGYYQTFHSFENIVLTFLVEMGGLFSAIYFGGVTYICIAFFKKIRSPSQKNLAGMYTIAVMVGFVFISCTFDTLRFPNLNWLFHSFLGLMVNLLQNSSEKQPESG